MSHPSLSPEQAERLEMLIEEASEVIQASTKILRHGYASFDPVWPSDETNAVALEREIMDFVAVVSAMGSKVDFILSDRNGFYSSKAAQRWEQKLRWTHHQPPIGQGKP